jgi:amino acid transporter
MTGAESDRSVGLLSTPTVSTVHALGQALAVGPILSVGFFSYLIAAAAGAATPLVMLLASVGGVALAWTFSLYARRYAGAGTVYEYLRGRYGAAVGVLGSGYYFLPPVLMYWVPLVFSLLFERFAVQQLGFDPGWWAAGVISVAVVFVLTYLDVRLSTGTLLGLTALSAVPFLAVSAVIIGDGGVSGNTLSVFSPSGAGAGNVFTGLLFGVSVFIGFEGAACLGEEAVLPHRTISRAMILSVAIVGVFVVVTLYAATIGFGLTKAKAVWGGDPFAFAGLGDRYIGRPVSALMSLGVLFDLFAVQIAITNTYARGYFALARDGLLPRLLARTSRRRTPVGGLILFALSGLIPIAAAIPFRDHFQVFEAIIIVLSIAILVLYIALCAGALRLVAERHWIWGYPLVLLGGAVPALGLYGTFDPFPVGAARVGVWMALGSMACVAVWFGFLRLRLPERIKRAAGHTLVSAVDRATE